LKKKYGRVLGLFEEDMRRRWSREYPNLKIRKQELKQQIPITKCKDLMLTLKGSLFSDTNRSESRGRRNLFGLIKA